MSDAFIAGIVVFVLAAFVGFEIIRRVPPTLHTPLMSGANAISGITIVGAIIAAALADGWHRVLTGWCVKGPAQRAGVAETRVRFKALDEHELGWYLDTEEWRDKAGGYGIQGRGAFLVAAVEGSYSNVVGLPLAEVVDALAACGVRPAPLSAEARRTEIIR